MTSWRERLAAGLTDEDKVLACRWTTCAVGEQHALHPEVVQYMLATAHSSEVDMSDTTITEILKHHLDRDQLLQLVAVSPKDGPLRFLGQRFAHAVNHGGEASAPAILDQIEDRVLQLKREAGVKTGA